MNSERLFGFDSGLLLVNVAESGRYGNSHRLSKVTRQRQVALPLPLQKLLSFVLRQNDIWRCNTAASMRTLNKEQLFQDPFSSKNWMVVISSTSLPLAKCERFKL
ncbi:hypothetical protein MTO96_014783 [Rhipicephalus appendiculatus]